MGNGKIGLTTFQDDSCLEPITYDDEILGLHQEQVFRNNQCTRAKDKTKPNLFIKVQWDIGCEGIHTYFSIYLFLFLLYWPKNLKVFFLCPSPPKPKKYAKKRANIFLA